MLKREYLKRLRTTNVKIIKVGALRNTPLAIASMPANEFAVVVALAMPEGP
jgi:hypothetical protein